MWGDGNQNRRKTWFFFTGLWRGEDDILYSLTHSITSREGCTSTTANAQSRWSYGAIICAIVESIFACDQPPTWAHRQTFQDTIAPRLRQLILWVKVQRNAITFSVDQITMVHSGPKRFNLSSPNSPHVLIFFYFQGENIPINSYGVLWCFTGTC